MPSLPEDRPPLLRKAVIDDANELKAEEDIKEECLVVDGLISAEAIKVC